MELKIFLDWAAVHRAETLRIAGTIDLALFPASTGDAKTAQIFDWKGGQITPAMKREVAKQIFDNKLGAACMQILMYAYMLERAYKVQVSRCVLVFCSESKTEEFEVARVSRQLVASWLGLVEAATDRSKASSLTLSSAASESLTSFSVKKTALQKA